MSTVAQEKSMIYLNEQVVLTIVITSLFCTKRKTLSIAIRKKSISNDSFSPDKYFRED